jgi:alpha-1,3-mannosyl-glycoprotein beta-1,2-N-acetylglucosaminyltransferase
MACEHSAFVPLSKPIRLYMISLTGLWRRSTSSYHHRHHPSPGSGNLLVSPASRAKSIGIHNKANNGRSPAPFANGGGGSGGCGHHHHHSPRIGIERYAVLGMLLIAWAWIMVFFGMIFYHGYQYNRIIMTSGSGMGAGVVGDHRIIPEPMPPPLLGGGIGVGAAKKEVLDEAARTTVDPPSLTSSTRGLVPHASPLLIFTCKRDNYLRETLMDVLSYVPDDCSMGCPVIVSQDGKSNEVSNVIAEFTETFRLQKPNVPFFHILHKSALRKGSNNSYQALAQHYGWALQEVLRDKNNNGPLPLTVPPQRVIILEEDIHISPDFFNYFQAMAPLLDADTNLLAVSAFNDNGMVGTVQDVTRVLRSDFFPGLGWMMTAKLYMNELKQRWPTGYWDDWLRDPKQRQNRHIIRPEVSRTFHFGTTGGASHNQFGTTLSKVRLNDIDVDWSKEMEAVDHVKSEAAFDEYYWPQIVAAPLVATAADASVAVRDHNVRLEYGSFAQFQQFARHFQLMDDEKAGIPRTAYKGVVETRPYGEYIIFLVPANVGSLFKTIKAR